MIRKGYEKSKFSAKEGRQFGSDQRSRPRKLIKRSSSFNNDVDLGKVTKRDRALIPAVPKFKENVKSQEVSEGMSVEFSCHVHGNPVPNISWMKDRKVLRLENTRMRVDHHEDGRCKLTIHSVTTEDRGSYSCTATNQLGKSSSSALLNVHVSTGLKKSRSSFESSDVRSNMKNNEFLARRKVKEDVSHIAHINGYGINSCGDSVKSSDSGISRRSSRDTCSSSSSYPPSVFSDNLSASSQGAFYPITSTAMGPEEDRPPQFSNKPRSQVVEESKSVNFVCHVDGNPPPSIVWYKGTAKVQTSERHQISEEDHGDCSLEIKHLKATDAGTYKCVAMNRAGKSSVSVELILAAKAPTHGGSNESGPTFSQPLTEVEVCDGGRARFECKVDGRPKPTVVWKKDGQVINATSRVRIMEMYGTHSLVLSRTDHGDTGTYSIAASNHVGNEKCSAQLRIKDSSYSSNPSTPRGRRSGYDSTEVATPTYSASSGSPATSALSSPSMSPKLGRAANSRLVSGSISSPWTSDAKSRAGGVGGSSPRRRAPGFILRPRPQTVACGEKMSLKCTLLGHPKPSIVWDRDGQKLDESVNDRVRMREDGNDYFLEIIEAELSDAGRYTVQAKNSLGKQSATVDIVITGTPGAVKSRSNHSQNNHEMSDKLNNNTTTAAHNTTKSQRIEVTLNSKNVNTNNNRYSENERNHGRVSDHILPPSNKEETKSSPTSQSSYVSSYSRVSNTSSRSSSSLSNEESPSQRSRRTTKVAPTFTRRLSSTQVLEGEELELHCEIAGNPTPELTWTRNGIRISKRESNTNIEYRDGSATLTVNQIKPAQAGEYLCVAKNDVGDTKCSSRVTVKPKPRQSKPKFIRPPKDTRIEEGETLSLEAEVSGQPEPEVLWSLDGEEISNGECVYRNNIANLILRDVSVASSGQYMCIAINDAGEDTAACRVRIKQKKLNIAPEFTAPLSDVRTKEGEDISLRCMVTCIPEPRVKWLFNDEVLDNGNGIEISYHDGVAALTLDQATAEDTGCFSCVAVNSEGESSTSCQVVVSELPPKVQPVEEKLPEFVTKFEDYIRAMEGDTVTMECEVRGTPEPEVTWTIDKKAIKNARIEFQNGRALLVIDSVTSDHGGNVVCSAKNSVGQVKHEGRLYVRAKREAPSFVTQLPSSVEVQEGKEVTFGCQIKGHPQPRVSWTRNGRNLSVLNTETSYEEGNASVRIRKAGSNDGGKYVCTARNLSGETESVCQVTVVQEVAAQKPEFKKMLSDTTLEEGDDIRLDCHILGGTDLQITWILDGQKLEQEDGDATFKDGVARMVLEDAMAEDSGVYECIAKNKDGEAKTSCKVVVSAKKAVEERPSFPIQLEDMTINENEDILLKCQVNGIPRPTITWLLDGDPIPDAEVKYKDDGNAELFLPDALPEDEGVYTCIAQNKLNRVMCSCKVTVKALPRVNKRKQTETAAKKESIVKVEVKTSSAVVTKTHPKKEEPTSNKSTPTSSSARLNGGKDRKDIHREQQSSDDEEVETRREGPDHPPAFIEELEDKVVPDGSINYKLTARVSGLPPPHVKWLVNGEEIEDSEDFRYETDGDKRRLVFAEIFPEDSGTYTCVAINSVGESKSSMKISVEEIDGDPPNFITKPRPLTINAGENALFNCKIDGEPAPTVQWLFCNQPIAGSDRIKITTPNSDNNYTHSLEVCETRIEDAGRYAACCSNLLGDVTCTVSLIVNAVKNQEERKDFRNVLKKSTSNKSGKADPGQTEQLDFRGVLKKTEPGAEASPVKSEDAPDFRDVLSRPVRTKVLSEEERKLYRAEQKDFRANLVRKVETKTVPNEMLKVKSPEQKDFRDEALKTKVKTKAYAEDLIKQKQAEQKDFRGEALKTKVVTKAYKEENLKMKRAEQVDFREVLSPTSKRQISKDETSPSESARGFDLPSTPARMKINTEHNTVATKRTRTRGGAEPSRRAKSDEREPPAGEAPKFTRKMKDIKVKDSDPFDLECNVSGVPAPKISWFLGDEEIHSEADISITQEGNSCRLHVAESFPDDDGTYTCCAENEHGTIKCSAHVTVVTDEPSSSQDDVPKFFKKQTSVTESPVPATIQEGPGDVTILRGNPISLCCHLVGTPPLKAVWRKGKNEIKHSNQCNIDMTNTSAVLTIVSSEKDDSGCYTLQVKNLSGVDQFSTNVSVVDAPDPPIGKSHASDIMETSLVLSWYGTGYDGGSTITSYQIEVAEVLGSDKLSEWSIVASAHSTSCTIKDLKPKSKYVFRVRAENKYGMSVPGEQSDIILNTITEVVDSSDEDEETFVKHGSVSVRSEVSFAEKYETKERLGQGRFGKVHRVVDRETGRQYAAKIMRALKAKDKEAVQQEIDVMNSLRHPRLVQLIDAYSHGREITMVMDLVSGGELFERVIDEDFELTEAACIKYMSQICDGLKFMHDTLILHLDLKPENIMCINKTGTQIKIIDFGLARRYNPKEVIRVMFGTPEFVAPEVINYDAIGPQTDMWSVGVICYILLSGLSPFMGDNDSETLSNITAAEWDFDDEAFDEISYEAKDFIRQLLVKPLGKRYTVNRALEHKWLKKDTNKMSKSKLNTKNLKRFLARRKWQKTGNAVRALGRLASLANLGASTSSSNPNKITNGQPRESGFLAALKAQLLRENEEEQETPETCKPMFEQLFDDVEVIEGSAAKFECMITGTPDPEIMWFKDDEPIKESRHYRISYTEDDMCTLLISDSTEADEAEYTCKAVNCEGEVEHRAELIVITPVENLESQTKTTTLCQTSSPSFPSLPSIVLRSSSSTYYAIAGQSVAFIYERWKDSKNQNSSSTQWEPIKWKKAKIFHSDLSEINDEENLRDVDTASKRIHIWKNGKNDDENDPLLEQSENDFDVYGIMVIQNVTKSDEGIYIAIETEEESDKKIFYKLFVAEEDLIHRKIKGYSPRFINSPSEQSFPELVNAVVECTVVGSPMTNIQWYQHGTRLFPNNRYRFSEEGSNATLTIMGTHWYDSGKYKCCAINTLGETSCMVDLYIEPPEHHSVEFDGSPMFLTRTESVTHHLGSTVTFACTVVGVPTPKVYWKRDGTTLTQHSNSRISTNDGQRGKHELNIRKTNATDVGKYVCVAENERGIAYCSCFLRLEGIESFNSPLSLKSANKMITPDALMNSQSGNLAPVFVTRPHRAVVNSGAQAFFRCTVHGAPDPVVSWFRDGRKLTSGKYYHIEEIYGHHCLRISKTRLSDRGTYICTAHNPLGELSCSVHLEVKLKEKSAAPIILFGETGGNQDQNAVISAGISSPAIRNVERPPQQVWLYSGKTVKLSLTVKGSPNPDVIWNKEGRRIYNENRYTVSSKDDLHTLKIVRVNKSDEGHYTIVAYNSAGLSVSNLTIRIREKPVVPTFEIFPARAITIHKKADATIRCKLKEEKKRSIARWMKDEDLISSENKEKYSVNIDGPIRELTIKDVNSSDSGIYTCKVNDQTATSEILVLEENEADMSDAEMTVCDGNMETTSLTQGEDISDKEFSKSVKITTSSLPTEMKVPENGKLVIQHTVDVPDVTSAWTLNGVKLEQSDRCKMITQDCKHILELSNVKLSDAGSIIYSIEGNDCQCETKLKVEALPIAPIKAIATKMEGTRVKLSWVQAEQVPSCDSSVLKYVIDRRNVTEDTWTEVTELSASVQSYLVSKLLPEETYQFRVRAKNKVGCSEEFAHTGDVYIAPQLALITGLVEEMLIDEGEVAHFTVQLNQANVQADWFLNGLKLTPRGENCQIQCTGKIHSLILRHLSATGSARVEFATKDSKITTCTKLMVKGKPVSIVKELEDATVVENADVSYSVALSRDVKQLGKWYHNGALLKGNHNVLMERRGEYRILTIKNVKKSASGFVKFELSGDSQVSSEAELIVKSWFDTEPFQKIMEHPPNSASVKAGGKVEISFRISSDGKCLPKWKHNGKPISIKSKKYRMKQEGDVLTLVVNDVTSSDAGTVECCVDKDHCTTLLVVNGSEPEETEPQPNIEKSTKISAFCRDSERIDCFEIEEEKDVELACHVRDEFTKVIWTKNGELLDTTEKNIEILCQGTSRICRISQTQLKDVGSYKCTLESNQDDAMIFEVKVKEKQQLFSTKLPSTTSVVVGSDMTLHVELDNPNSETKWLKNGIILKSGKAPVSGKKARIRQIETSNTHQRQLVISDVTAEDSGEYTCKTSHDVTTTVVEVKVPALKVIEKMVDVEIEEKDTASFTIKLSRKTSEKVIWKLKDKKLTPNKKCQISCIENAHSLTLRSLTLQDCGIITFQCGDLTQNAKLTVTVPPAIFSKQLLDATGIEGREAIFNCEISSENALVEWRRGEDEVISSSAKYVCVRVGRSRTLSIKNLTFDDAGIYACHTEVDSTICTLKVEAPKLEVIEDIEDVEVMVEGTASFTLNLSQLNVLVTWMKDDKVLENIDNKLQIRAENSWHALHWRKLEEEDSGLITAEVDGEIIAEAILHVKKAPPVITRELRDQVIDLKTPAEFFCEVSDPSAQCTWYRDNVKLDTNSDDTAFLNFTFASEGTVRRLMIGSTYRHHEGKYCCVVNESRDKTSCELFVKVPKVDIIKPLENVQVFVGDDAEFHTEVSCAAVDGEWMIDNEIIHMDDKVEFSKEHELRILRLYGVAESAVISFRAAKNSVTTCRLEVTERPITILRRLSDMNVLVGESIVLECEFSKPGLDVSWFYDEEELTSSDKVSMSADSCRHILEVRDANYSDEGNYTCKYKHKRTSSDIRIEEPRVHVIEELQPQSIMEGESTLLECILSNSAVKVSWYKDDERIYSDEDVLVEKGEHFSKHCLVIKNVERKKAGNYAILVGDKVLSTTEVTVRALPNEITQHLQDIKVLDDVETVTLECQFSRSTPVTWKRDGEVLKVSEKFETHSSEDRCLHRLTINMPDAMSSEYTCTAEDTSCESACNLIVEKYRIRLEPGLPEEITYLSGKSGQLQCETSLPVDSTEVEWIIDGVPIGNAPNYGKYGRISRDVRNNTHMLLFDCVQDCLHAVEVQFICRNVKSKCVLEVASAPSKPCNPSSYVSDEDNDDVIITWLCPENDGRRPVEYYEIFTTVVGSNMEAIWERKARIYSSYDEITHTATLRDLEYDITYRIRILAVNCVGASKPAECENTITILSPLQFLNHLDDVVVREGETLELSCQLSRAFRGHTVWECNGEELSENDHIMLLANDILRELIIEEVDVKYAGTYSCTVDDVTTSCQVIVEEDLHFVTSANDISAELENDIAFSCEVSHESAHCKWTRNGKEIVPGSRFLMKENGCERTLTILSCGKEDVGTYECLISINGEHLIATSAKLELHDLEDVVNEEDLGEKTEDEDVVDGHTDEDQITYEDDGSCNLAGGEELGDDLNNTKLISNPNDEDSFIPEEEDDRRIPSSDEEADVETSESATEKNDLLSELHKVEETNHVILAERKEYNDVSYMSHQVVGEQVSGFSRSESEHRIPEEKFVSDPIVVKPSADLQSRRPSLEKIEEAPSDEQESEEDFDEVDREDQLLSSDERHFGNTLDDIKEEDESNSSDIIQPTDSICEIVPTFDDLNDCESPFDAEMQMQQGEGVQSVEMVIQNEVENEHPHEEDGECNVCEKYDVISTDIEQNSLISSSEDMENTARSDTGENCTSDTIQGQSPASSAESTEAYDTAAEFSPTDDINYMSAESDLNTLCESDSSQQKTARIMNIENVKDVVVESDERTNLDLELTGNVDGCTSTPANKDVSFDMTMSQDLADNEMFHSQNNGSELESECGMPEDISGDIPVYISSGISELDDVIESDARMEINQDLMNDVPYLVHEVTPSHDQDSDEKIAHRDSDIELAIRKDDESNLQDPTKETEVNKIKEMTELQENHSIHKDDDETPYAHNDGRFNVFIQEKQSCETDVTAVVIDLKTGVVESKKVSQTLPDEQRLNQVLGREVGDSNEVQHAKTVQTDIGVQETVIPESFLHTHAISTSIDEISKAVCLKFADICLPEETAEDKMARLFGLNSKKDNGEASSHTEFPADNIQGDDIHQENPVFYATTHFYGGDDLQCITELTQEAIPALEQRHPSFVEAINGDEDERSDCEIMKLFGDKKCDKMGINQYHDAEPSFTAELSDQTAVEGQSALFRCTITGHPTPFVRLQKEIANEVFVLSNDTPGLEIRYNEDLDGVFMLKIHRVKSEDGGQYTCTAINVHGDSSSTSMLQVIASSEDNPPESENELQLRSPDEDSHEVKNCPGVRDFDEQTIFVPSMFPRPKPLTIRVKERVIVRESSYASSDSRENTTSDETGTSSSCSLDHERPNTISERKTRSVRSHPTPKRFYSSDDSSKSADDTTSCGKTSESCSSTVGEHDVCSATENVTEEKHIMDCGSNSGSIIQSLPGKNDTKKPYSSIALNIPRISSPTATSDSGTKRKRSSVASLQSSSCDVGRKATDREDVMSESLFTVSSWPDMKSEMSASINACNMLLTGIPEATSIEEDETSSIERQVLQNLIHDEERYISILRRSNHILQESTDLPSVVEERMYEIFGDLEGLCQFHTSILLPELTSCTSSDKLPHIFINLSKYFEQLHVTHLMNTHNVQELFKNHKVIHEGICELSSRVDFDMKQVTNKPAQQLIQYQLRLKELLRSCKLDESTVTHIQEAIRLLADIPVRARLIRKWCEVKNRPLTAEHFGELSKEGVFQLLDSSLVPSMRRCKMRQLFLFEKYLVVCKLKRIRYCRETVTSQYDRIFKLDTLHVKEDPEFTDDRTFIVSSLNEKGERIWQANLRAHNGNQKRSWCRILCKSIESIKGFSGPSFQEKLVDVIISSGQDINLSCHVAGQPRPSIEWYKDGNVIESSDDKIRMVYHDQGICELKIMDATCGDAGKYTCKAVNDVGEQSTEACVTVLETVSFKDLMPKN